MRPFNRLLLTALAACCVQLSISSTALAREGGGIDSGGGDPLAVQFVQIGHFLAMNAKTGGADVDGAALKKLVSAIEASLEGKSPRLVFPAGDTVSCFGAPKLGCAEKGRIRIARAGWEKATLADKIQVAAMELFLTLGLSDRYARAAKVSKALAPRLALSDGNIVFPRTIDKALGTVLGLLNEKENPQRKLILNSRAGSCIALSHECKLAMDADDKNEHVFTRKDIISIAYVGKGMNYDPCKQEKCFGEDEETREFLVIVKSASIARWGHGPLPLVFSLRYSRKISQQDGSIKSSNFFELFKNTTGVE